MSDSKDWYDWQRTRAKRGFSSQKKSLISALRLQSALLTHHIIQDMCNDDGTSSEESLKVRAEIQRLNEELQKVCVAD